MKKILFSLLSIIVIAIVGLLSFLKFALPNVGEAEDITINATPAMIERGSYLANSVSVCMDCHSERDWTKFSGPLIEGTLGQGGEEFSQKYGFPGKYFAKNITPYGLKDWTDGEILRAISTGVSKNGSALFPVMPHPNFGKLDKQDLISIIAYIRTLAPIEKEIPEASSDFPMNFIINTIPQKAAFSTIPEKSNTLEYGKYLFTAASCNDCHTMQDKGKSIVGMELAGGFEFPLPSGAGIVRSANITPDTKTGIGKWTEEMFVNRFKTYADSSYTPNTVAETDFNTVMPWMMYSGMENDDLKAIYQYLKTMKPIEHKVVKFTPANI